MPLPIILYPGLISIYGVSTTGTSGIVPVNNRLQFGTVYQSWANIEGNIQVGQVVLFPIDKCEKIEYAGEPYFIIDETKIISIENPAP